MKKRLCAVLLSIVMVFGCFGIQVFAADWEKIVDLPQSFVTFTAEGHNGKLYLFESTSVEIYDLRTDTWEKGAGNPYNLINLTSVRDKNTIMSVTNNFSDNTQYIWTSSDPSVASVVNGAVTALSPGLTYITAERFDGAFRESIPVRVVGQGLTIIQASYQDEIYQVYVRVA